VIEQTEIRREVDGDAAHVLQLIERHAERQPDVTTAEGWHDRHQVQEHVVGGRIFGGLAVAEGMSPFGTDTEREALLRRFFQAPREDDGGAPIERANGLVPARNRLARLENIARHPPPQLDVPQRPPPATPPST